MLEHVPEDRRARPPFEGDIHSARRIANRLLSAAHLSLEPDLKLDAEHGPDEVAWFHGINMGRAVMGVRGDQLKQPEMLVASLAHEVAHAVPTQKRLVHCDCEEEFLTDLTAVFLGFGVAGMAGDAVGLRGARQAAEPNRNVGSRVSDSALSLFGFMRGWNAREDRCADGEPDLPPEPSP
jgi:hypothetical protein